MNKPDGPGKGRSGGVFTRIVENGLSSTKTTKMKKLDSKDAREIGADIGIDWDEVRLDEFTKGINVEFEHGTRFPETNVTNDDRGLTGKIAWAHLKEFPDYYSRLAKLETEAAEYWKSKGANPESK